MRNRITLLLLAALPLLFVLGCSSKKPTDWPDAVYPVKITATNNGSPMADLQVVFGPTNGTMTYAVGGTTNSSGVAVMETRGAPYSQKGVPAGEYRVTFAANLQPTRTVDEAYELPAEERQAYLDAMAEEVAQLKANNPVPSGLSGGTSELIVTVGEGGLEQAVEFSEFSDDGSTREAPEIEERDHP
ncbi:MAG: hypothetical protein IJG02_03000 [Thermoguttaceae bacterium]|nr:hypothetical protein [Thermoguttaceae bacterium]